MSVFSPFPFLSQRSNTRTHTHKITTKSWTLSHLTCLDFNIIHKCMFSTAVAILRFAYLNSHFFFFKIQTLDRCRPFFLFWVEYQCIGDSRILIGSFINLSVCLCARARVHTFHGLPSTCRDTLTYIRVIRCMHVNVISVCQQQLAIAYWQLFLLTIDHRSKLRPPSIFFIYYYYFLF